MPNKERGLDQGYKAMAADKDREAEAREWLSGIRINNPAHLHGFVKTEIPEPLELTVTATKKT